MASPLEILPPMVGTGFLGSKVKLVDDAASRGAVVASSPPLQK
jgi:hypothetical protein